MKSCGACFSSVAWAILACIGLLNSPSSAQQYRFTVEQMDLQVTVQPDASARLQYKIVFQNSLGANPIDVVDIGLPHRDYSISNMSAWVDDVPLRDIRRSEYIDVGVEVHLAGRAIAPGDRGVFRFECLMPDMVYQDTTDTGRASLQIKPTWFDPSLQMGATDLRVAIHLTPSVKAEEVVYHEEQNRYDELVLFGEGDAKHVVAIWDRPGVRLSADNPKLGISFPQRDLDRVVRITALGLFYKWFSESSNAQWVSGLLVAAAWVFLFFRFTGGTGCVLFVLLSVGLVVLLTIPAWNLTMWPIVGGLVGVNEWFRSRRKRSYLPVMATVEGGGIKRGLTAPQAALLLELPLGHVLTLIMFGLLKKGVVRQTAADPLTVEVDQDFQTSRKIRLKNSAKRGVVIHAYEHPFIDRLFQAKGAVEQCDFSEAMGKLIEATGRAMKGFDLSDTQEYYRLIVGRAWKEAAAIGKIEARAEKIDRDFDWMMLDPQWRGRFGSWERRGYYYRPSWARADSAGPAAPDRPSAPNSQTSLGEVAASFAGWAENTTGRLAAAIEPGSMGLKLPSRAALDLSGLDRVTGEVFEALAKSASSGGGGRGGGGCACACAGCACACACAGGGR